MRKLVVLGTLVFALTLFAFRAPAAQPLGIYMFQNLEDVEIEGTFKGIATLGGRLFLVIDVEGKENYVLAPMFILRSIDLEIYAGEKLKVTGKEIAYDSKTVVMPTKISYKGQDYDISRFYGMPYGYYGPMGKPYNWNYRGFHPGFGEWRTPCASFQRGPGRWRPHHGWNW